MSRLWSRFGLRTLSIGLLLAVVIGGLYLLQNRQAGSGGNPAAAATNASVNAEQLAERTAVRAASTSRQRAAQQQAEKKAKAAAKAAAKRAGRVNDAATRKKEEAESAGAGTSGNKATVPYAGPIPSSCNEYKGNRRTGCALLLDAGFGLDQMSCLDRLWKKESGWNHRARNNSSGAYGIPQALPGSKMGTVADDWETNPATQIKWGLKYIKGRYGTPCGAWGHSQDVGWY